MRVIERKQRVHGTPEKAKRDREEAIQLKRKRMESFEDACREFEGVPKAVEDMRDFHSADIRDGNERRAQRVEPPSTPPRVPPHVCWDSNICLLYTSPSPRDLSTSRMPSSA